MAGFEKDDVPMVSDTNGQLLDEHAHSQFNRFSSRTRSVSISIPMNNMESYESETNLGGHSGPLRSERRTPFIQMSDPLYVSPKPENLFQTNQEVTGHKTTLPMAEMFPSSNVNDQNDCLDDHLLTVKLGMCNDRYCRICPTYLNSKTVGKDQNDWPDDNYAGKNENLLRSGQLGMCNDPYCTTCPTNSKAAQQKNSKASSAFDPKFYNALFGDDKGWARRCFSFLEQYIPGVMNPHTKVVRQWNKFFVISCFVAIFVDPLFFFLLSVQQDNKCIVINMPMATTIVTFRSMTDLIYFLHMLLQFRLAYMAPESGDEELIEHPEKIARNYLCGYFTMDLFVTLPLPQIIILLVLRTPLGFGKKLLRTAVLVQYLPRLYRFLPLLVDDHSPSGFVFESAWANFVINLLTFVLSGHVVGSFWYLFGLQRVNQCLRDACIRDPLIISDCKEFIDCGHGNDFRKFWSDDKLKRWESSWKVNSDANTCFSEDGFSYGIYKLAVNLTTNHSILKKYTYSLFWGFQQISTLAGNQVPSDFICEVLFTMAIIGLGLLLFALLIGNIQNFLQALGRRRLEMSLRVRDVEQWMIRRRFSKELRRRIRLAEQNNWAANKGIDEETLLKNFPEEIRRDIRRHPFKFLKKVSVRIYLVIRILQTQVFMSSLDFTVLASTVR